MKTSFISQGEGPAVIFLHGLGSGKEGWTRQVDAVVDAGWRFVAIDAPGFGRTPLPRKPGFTPHVACIIEVMDALDVERAVLCGHSMGGMTAQELVAEYPHRVSGLILSATSPAFGRPDGEFQKKFLRDRLAPFDNGMDMEEFATIFASGLVGPSPAKGAIDEIIGVMKTVSVDAYRCALHTIAGFDRRENLQGISVDTLLIAGDADRNAPASMMEKMAGKIAEARFVCLDHTGHMAPIENPAAFNQHVIQFLQRISRS